MKATPVIPFGHSLRSHPDFGKLLLDPDYYWRPAMASVARPSTVAGECAVLRETAEQTDKELRGLRNEVGELRRIVAECRVRRAADDDGLCPQTPRPRIEIPPSVRRTQKAGR